MPEELMEELEEDVQVQQDFMFNGSPGDTAEQLSKCRYNVGLYRPYRDYHGNRCVDVFVGNQYDPTKGKSVPTYEKMTMNEAKFRGYESPTLYIHNAAILS